MPNDTGVLRKTRGHLRPSDDIVLMKTVARLHTHTHVHTDVHGFTRHSRVYSVWRRTRRAVLMVRPGKEVIRSDAFVRDGEEAL